MQKIFHHNLQKNELFKDFKGAMAENFVLTELICQYEKELFYWKSENIAEVDFVLQQSTHIVPIEVKAEQNDKSKSLAEYIKRYNPKIPVKTSMKNIAGDYIRHIPLYMLWQIEKYLH